MNEGSLLVFHNWGQKKSYQATAIQLAGERSTLLKDISPGYLWAKPVIWIKEQQRVNDKQKERSQSLIKLKAKKFTIRSPPHVSHGNHSAVHFHTEHIIKKLVFKSFEYMLADIRHKRNISYFNKEKGVPGIERKGWGNW